MKKYELMYILRPSLDDEARKAFIERYHAYITNNGGKITSVNEWGLRDLAYEIDDDTMELLEQQTSKEESNVKIDLSKFTKFKKILKETRKDIIENNAILVVPQQYRQIIFILVSQLFMDIPVICFEEVNLDYKLTILGKI